MAKKQQFPLYLIYGNNETEVSNARFDLVNELLTPEERDAGLTEVRGPGNQPLTLDRAMSEIMEELGTTSFISGSRRVVVVYDLKEFFSAKRGGRKKTAKKPATKKTASRTGVFTDWLRDVLPATENIAIFVCTENDEKSRTVNMNSELMEFFRQHGKVIECREKPMNFEFEDLLLSQNGPAALITLRDWMRRTGNDSSGRLRIYTTVANVVELALQARADMEAKEKGIPSSHTSVQGFPSIVKIPGWKAEKVRRFASHLSPERLHRAITHLNKLQRIMYPSGDENYIPNWEDYLEMIVMELTLVR